MTTTTPTLEAVRRERLGTRYARRYRAAGQLPAVIYGHKQDPVSVLLDSKAVLHSLEHGSRLFNVALDGRKETCLVKDLQFDYLGDTIIHVDLTRVDLSEEIEVRVDLHFVGDAVGLKVAGAVLNTPMVTIEIACRADSVPTEGITVDLSNLEAGASIHAADLTLPEGIRIAEDPEAVIAYIEVRGEMEEVAAPAEDVEPEVITERKKDEEESSEE